MLGSYRQSIGGFNGASPIRSATRHTRCPDSESPRSSGTARDGHLAQNLADDKWSIRGEGGISVSCSSSYGRGRLAHLHVGRIGDQPACKVLFADKSWQKATSE